MDDSVCWSLLPKKLMDDDPDTASSVGLSESWGSNPNQVSNAQTPQIPHTMSAPVDPKINYDDHVYPCSHLIKWIQGVIDRSLHPPFGCSCSGNSAGSSTGCSPGGL